MSSRLRPSQTLLLGSLIFGLFFGAGNLIFPAQMGRTAGQAAAVATAGFLITAVGLPLLGVVAAALSRARDMRELTSATSRRFALAFTCALYLTIGPLFAIPRTATVSYEVGIRPLLSPDAGRWPLVAFSLVFFALTAAAALRPGRLLDWVGRYLTPLFLVLLAALVVAAIVRPMTGEALPSAAGPYADRAFTAGLLDGYNTMDALASLALAIVIVDAVRRLGVSSPGRMAAEIGKASVVAGAGMAIVYGALAFIGATSVGSVAEAANGGALLAAVSRHLFGGPGQVLIAAIVFVACLKTAIGLITACGEMFAALLPVGGGYRWWTLGFVAVSLLIANAGLATIVSYSIPVLMFLYPLTIVTILLGLATPLLARRRPVYRWVVGATALAAVFDLLAALPAPLSEAGVVTSATRAAGSVLPGFESGFGWVVPALVGLVVGLVHAALRPEEVPSPAALAEVADPADATSPPA